MDLIQRELTTEVLRMCRMYLYSGMEVASCVLEFSNKYKYGITNLMLQNILYYIQLNFLKKYHEPIFSDDILALRFGPCVQDVYDRFNVFTRFPIYCPDIESCIDDIEVRILIHQVVNACTFLEDWQLAERAQKKGGPWHQTFWNRRKVIPIEVMKKYVEEKG